MTGCDYRLLTNCIICNSLLLRLLHNVRIEPKTSWILGYYATYWRHETSCRSLRNIPPTVKNVLYALISWFKSFLNFQQIGHSILSCCFSFSIPRKILSVYENKFHTVFPLHSTDQILFVNDKFVLNVSFHFWHVSLYVVLRCGRQNVPGSDLPTSCNTFCSSFQSVEVVGRFLIPDTEGGPVSTQRWDGGSGDSPRGEWEEGERFV